MSWKNILSIADFSPADVQEFITRTQELKSSPERFRNTLAGKRLALLFFEPSTRTFTSFRNAMVRLGGDISMEFRTPAGTSLEKRESLKDTLAMAQEYGTTIAVIRHPRDGAATYAADVTPISIINGGDGHREHPTQNLMDLFTIHERFGKLDHLTFLFFNDLKFGRATRLILPLSHYDGNRFLFLSHPFLTLPDSVKKIIDSRGCVWEEFTDAGHFPTLLRQADVAYGSRTQEERFPQTTEGREMLMNVRDSVVLTREIAEQAGSRKRIILHPLPMDREHPCIAGIEGPSAYWNRQAGNGIPARQALLLLTAHAGGMM